MFLNIKENELLSKHTTLRVGGPARYFVEVKTEKEIKEAFGFAQEKNLPVFILGGGSNTLAPDSGYPGVVIKIKNNDFKIDGETVIIGAGYITALAARQISEASLTGFEWAVTLPGTIGGAIFGNAGCFGSETGDVIETVNVFDPQKAESCKLKAVSCGFGYRNSIFKKKTEVIILSATLKLQKGNKEKIKTEMQQFLNTRKTTQPLDCPSAGCMFKNYEIKSGERFNFSVPNDFLKNGKIPAGWLVEQVGAKGAVFKGVKISDRHGNFLLNTKKANAREIKAVVRSIKEKVKEKFGLSLEMEVREM